MFLVYLAGLGDKPNWFQVTRQLHTPHQHLSAIICFNRVVFPRWYFDDVKLPAIFNVSSYWIGLRDVLQDPPNQFDGKFAMVSNEDLFPKKNNPFVNAFWCLHLKHGVLSIFIYQYLSSNLSAWLKPAKNAARSIKIPSSTVENSVEFRLSGLIWAHLDLDDESHRKHGDVLKKGVTFWVNGGW